MTYEEWRIVAKLALDPDELWALLEVLAAETAVSTDVRLRREGQLVAYAMSEEDIAHAEAVLRRLLEQARVRADLKLSRWNPGAERWQDPTLPVEPPKYELESAWTEIGELGWEVRVKTERMKEAQELERWLRHDERAVFSDGWRRITVGVRTEDEAARLAEDLRLELPRAEI
jgi:hypothetical protein